MTHQILIITKFACVGTWWIVSKKENCLFFQEIQGFSTAEEIDIYKLCFQSIIMLTASYFLVKTQVVKDKEDLSVICMLDIY